MHTDYSMKAPEREESEMKIKKDITQSKGCKYQARKANSEIVEFQRKNMSKSQRKSSMKYLKRGVYCCLLTNKKWLLKFIKKKKGIMRHAQWKEPKFKQLHKKMKETNVAWLLGK